MDLNIIIEEDGDRDPNELIIRKIKQAISRELCQNGTCYVIKDVLIMYQLDTRRSLCLLGFQ